MIGSQLLVKLCDQIQHVANWEGARQHRSKQQPNRRDSEHDLQIGIAERFEQRNR